MPNADKDGTHPLRIDDAQSIAIEVSTNESYRLAKYLLWREIGEIEKQINLMEQNDVNKKELFHRWRGCVEQNRKMLGQNEIFGEEFSGENFKKFVFDQIFHREKNPIIKAKEWLKIKERMFLNFPECKNETGQE